MGRERPTWTEWHASRAYSAAVREGYNPYEIDNEQGGTQIVADAPAWADLPESERREWLRTPGDEPTRRET